MKCDNCGNEFKNSLKCPLCGWRQGKISRCSVCGTIIHFGQAHCSKCGNPTKYVKREDISSKYASKFMPTNYSKHSNKTHVYQQQEMYDYKSSNDDIKQRLLEARSRFNNFDFAKKSENNGDKLKNILIVVIVIMVSAAIILSQVMSKDKEDDSVKNSADLEMMEITGDNNNLVNTANYRHNGYLYLDNGDFYMNIDGGIVLTDRNFSDKQMILEGAYSNIYVEDNYLYFNEYGTYMRYDQQTTDRQQLFIGEGVIPIGKHRFIYNGNEDYNIMLYNEGQITNITSDRAVWYCFDETSELIYYQYNLQVYAANLAGENVAVYDIDCSGDMYVDNGKIYYVDYEGIKVYDIKEDRTRLLMEKQDVYQFTIVDDGIVYTDFDNVLLYYQNEEQGATHIASEVSDFNVAGNLIVYRSLNEDYLENWFVSDRDGIIAKLS